MGKPTGDRHAKSVRWSKDIPVTIIVPIRNEERNLAGCLSRLGRFANVIVVDSNSTDRSVEIAQSFNAKVLHFEWNGLYPKKRNWVLMNHALADAWVLFLDADELVDGRFCDEVASAVSSSHHNGYWINYTNYFLGRRLRHGVPQRKLALLRVGCGFYERIEENYWSEFDMEIHEHPIVDGSLGEIVAPIEHNDFRGIEQFLKRHQEYARWEARRFLLLNSTGQMMAGNLTSRQRFKYRHLASWWYAWFYFLYTYIAKLGFLDGAPGFQYAFYKAWYFNTTRLLIDDQLQRPAPPKSSEDG